jgi:hypothetical protein
MAVNFDPDPELLAKIEKRLEDRTNKWYVWDFVNEGTDAGEAESLARTIVKAEREDRRWVCCVVDEGTDDERLVLEPEDDD